MIAPRISLIFALLATLLSSVPYRTVALAAATENIAPPADPQITAATSDPNVTGNGFASFLLGLPTTAAMTNASPLDGYFRYSVSG